jgi:hypothetical protein
MLLGLLKSVQQVQPRNQQDAEILRLLGSIKMDHRKDRAILTATVPVELLEYLTSSAASDSATNPEEPAAEEDTPSPAAKP